jgi:hypothetical protein
VARRPFWHRRWVLLGAGGPVLMASILVCSVDRTWLQRGRFFHKSMKSHMVGSSRLSMLGSPGSKLGKLPIPPRQDFTEVVLNLSEVPISPLLAENGVASPELPFVGEIAPCLALTGDLDRGLLLTSSLDGRLRWYDKTSLRLLGSSPLLRPAYQMVLDGPRGLLITASVAAKKVSLGPLADNQNLLGSIDIYDMAPLLANSSTKGSPLVPRQTFPVNSRLSTMYLSADGMYVHYLADSSQRAYIGKVDTRHGKLIEGAALPHGGTTALAQAPGGGTLYALASGRLFAIDPKTGKLSDAVRVGPTVATICAGENGRLFLLERRQQLVVHAIDFSSGTVMSSWSADLDGRVFLRNSPDGKRIYLGNSTVYDASISQVDAAAAKSGPPTLLAHATSNRDRLVRGVLLVTPDGEYVVTGSGLVFRARE